MRSSLLREEISAHRVEHFKKPLSKESEYLLKTLGSIGAWTVREIMAIHGVMEIRIKPKEILIKKEMSSSWEGIEDRVINVLKRAMRRKQIRLVKH